MSSRVTRGVYRALLRTLSACEKEHVPLGTWRDDFLLLAGPLAPRAAMEAASGAPDVAEVRAALRAAFRQPLPAPGDDGAALDAALGALRALGTRRKAHESDGSAAESTSCSRQSHGITCAVTSRFMPDMSIRDDEFNIFQVWAYTYSVTFTNNGTHPVQLATRHWAITTHHPDGTHTTEHVRGAGVVGKSPKLLVGESYQYQSFCVLKTPRGTMRGDFEFVSLTGEDTYTVECDPFALRVPPGEEPKN